MKWILKVCLICIFLISACKAGIDRTSEPATSASPTLTAIPFTPMTSPLTPAHIHTTQNNLFGNHFMEGHIDLPNASTLDIPLDGTPLWLVSAAVNNEAIFVAVLENGQVQAFKISGQTYEPFNISPTQLPAGMSPILVVSDNTAQLIAPPQGASPLTNPIRIDNSLIYIATNGDLVLNSTTLQKRLSINALLDARILIDEQNRLLILTQPTTRYDHGVVGNKVEASEIVLIETEPEIKVIQTIPIDTPDVIEGISPIWADIDNDGTRDIIVTVSNSQSGSRIVAFREDGTLLAESPPIGTGYRWRHQIAVADFEVNGVPLLVSVRTPHIGGVVEFFQFKNGNLEIVKEINGFSTHSIGSRNLDSAIVGDFNNDGVNELLAPDQFHTNLGIVSLNEVLATLPLDGTLTSNLSATTIDGEIILGAGTANKLRIWLP